MNYSEGAKYIMNTYSRFPLVLEKGEGMYVYDTDGKKYLDFVAGIAVNSLGHSHPALSKAITEQASKLIHCSNLYWTNPQISLAEKLVKNSCFSKVFFCNSGAESIEGALKLSRKYAAMKGYDRFEIITMHNSFHGRTFGAVTATGQPKYQKDLQPLLPGIKYADFNDFDSLMSQITDKTCAILIEPVQGEGGIRNANKEYLQKIRKLCDDKDILLMFDEVQCGVGRTGYLFAYEAFCVKPDVVSWAKGLAGGVPIGALLVAEKAVEAFQPGDHASTFGGNPLATSAANVVIDTLLSDGMLSKIKNVSNYLDEKLSELMKKHTIIKEIRGTGLLKGIELSVPCADIIKKCISNGLLLVGAGANVIRFVPPLIVTENEIDEMCNILDKSFS